MARENLNYSKEGQNKKFDLFARELVVANSTQSNAYLAAHPEADGSDKHDLSVRAYRFKKRPEVQARIRYWEKKRQEAFAFDIKELATLLHDMAFHDIADFYDEKGHVLPIHEIPERLRRLIKKVEHGLHYREVVDPKTGVVTQEPVMTIAKYELESRKSAIDKIIELGGVLAPTDERDSSEPVNKKQLARKILNLMHQAGNETALAIEQSADEQSASSNGATGNEQ